MTERKIVTVKVLDLEQYVGVWPPTAASEFVAWFMEKIDSIPAEYRDSALVEIDSTSRYDSTYATLSITYRRPETDDEVARRTSESERRREAERRREMATLAALKAKYGDS